MTPQLLNYLCDPVDKSLLKLVDASYYPDGIAIKSGTLVSQSGRSYPIREGVPRFVDSKVEQSTVDSFGDEWNHFNYDAFKLNWDAHTVKNTFGSVDVFRGKVVVDCGAGSGMQTKWISEAGALHVIALELSHAVDGVIRKNLEGCKNFDVVQCSITNPPLRDLSVDGIVICHNVIQHTESVEMTAAALWDIVGPGGEFVFNCYPKNDQGVLRKMRLLIYAGVRAILSRSSFSVILWYSRIMSALRFIPIVGLFLEKSGVMVRGDVPPGGNWSQRAFKAGVLNTYDCFGSHSYQHLKTNEEIRDLVHNLQPDVKKVLNAEGYYKRPPPIGIALRLFR